MKNEKLLKEWAERLQGRQYGSEITEMEAIEMAYQGIVAIFGASDDLLEFEGAISDELEAINGTTVHLTRNQRTDQYEAMDDIMDIPPYCYEICKIEAVLCPKERHGTTWEISTNSPNSVSFDIMEGEDIVVFCKAILIAL